METVGLSNTNINRIYCFMHTAE